MLGFTPEKKKAPPRPGANGKGFASAGAEKAQAMNQAPDSIPAMVKPGEFVLPPDTVHAVGGVKALQGVVDATHTPAPKTAVVPRGFKPEMFFANGGLTDDVTRIGNSYSGGNVGGSITVNGQAGAGTMSTVPGQPVPSPVSTATPPTVIAQRAVAPAQSVPATVTNPATPAVPGASPAATPTATSPAAPKVDAFTQRNLDVSASSITRNGGRFDQTPAAAVDPEPDPAIPARKPAVPLVQQFADGGPVRGLKPQEDQILSTLQRARANLQDGTAGAQDIDSQIARRKEAMTIPDMLATPFVKPKPPAPAPVAANPTDLRLASGAQSSPLGYQRPSAPATETQAAAALAAPADNPTRGFDPNYRPATQPENLARGFAPAGITAPTVRHSGNSWQAANDLRNARVSASSIMNNGGRWDRHGKGVVSPERAAYLAMLGTDQALKQAQPVMEQAAMRENAGLQREGLQQQGANARTSLTAGIDQQRLGLEQTAAGFKTRAAARLEGLQNAYQSAKTDAERGALARQIREIQGTEKGDQWKAVALQGGTDAQGNRTESILGAVNERTGEMRRMEGQGQTTSTNQRFQLGQVYVDGQGRRAKFNGTGWEPA